MTSTISSAILVLSVAATAFAATAYGPADSHPDRPGECWDQKENAFYKPGDSWTQQGCMEASCLELNATGIPKLFVTFQSCGVMAVEAPCYLAEDKTQSYPDCCPEIVCPDSEEEEAEDVRTSSKPDQEPQVKQTPTTQMVDVAGRTSDVESSTSTTQVPATSSAPPATAEPTKDSRSDFDEFNSWGNHFSDDDDSDNQVSTGDTYRLFDIFRKTFAWDDYSYNDVMDNNVVDDAPYGNSPDYYHNYGKRLSTGFTEDDFDIKGFKWF